MKEWSKKNEFNSFNSWKGLLYAPWYQSMVDWRDHKIKAPLPPVEASLDPIHACNLQCSHCFNGEELISLADFSSKKIKDLVPGDKVLGLQGGKLVSSLVRKVFNNGETDTLLKFTFEDGDTFECTAEHRLWESRGRWKKAGYFHIGEHVKKAFRFHRPNINKKDYQRGYIAGMACGDGCFWLNKNRSGSRTGRFRLAIRDTDAIMVFGQYCTELGIAWHWGKHTFNGHKDYQAGKKFTWKALWITDDTNARKIRDLMDIDEDTVSFKIGWVSGIFDAEGCGSNVIRISQYPSLTKTKLMNYLRDLNYPFVEEEKGIRLIGRTYDQLNFLLDINNKLLRKRQHVFLRKVCSKKKIIKIEKIRGTFEKYDIETETTNYFVKGVLVHNCNAASYLLSDLQSRTMTDDHLINLVRFLGHWGVKAVCFGGGGEPTMHPSLALAISESYYVGMQSSIATNGTLFTDTLIPILAQHCRWVGISVDAATRKTYQIGRKQDGFDTVVKNIKKLVHVIKKFKTPCDVAFKFLIFDYNQHEIYKACKLAKELGVKDFHARPADFSHQGMKQKKTRNPYNTDKVLEQFEKCHKLEDKDFRVFTVVHKFDDSFKPRKDFAHCYAAPCCIQLCADGNVYLCPDTRHLEFYKLGRHSPDPKQILEFWGGEKHYDLVFNSGKKNCSTRCTFSPYCKQAEELFIKKNDPMCRFFI